MSGRDDYLLGHDEVEWGRLERQHRLWRSTLLEPLRERGLGPGARILEVGCGNGTLLAELASEVGPTGVARGLERDPAAAERACRHAGVPVEVGDLTTAPLDGPWDLVVARWVFSFLPDSAGAVGRLADVLAPGGSLVVQDYDHDGMGLFPRQPEVDRVIEAFREAYRRRGGDLYVAGRLPQDFAAAGLEDLAVTPHVCAGRPGDAVWAWVEDFLHAHVDGLVSDEVLTAEEVDGFRAAWARARQVPGVVLFSPLQVVVAGRRPGAW